MFRKALTFMMAIFLISSVSFAQDGFISFMEHESTDVFISSYKADEIILKINSHGAFFSLIYKEGRAFADLSLDKGSVYGEIGEPKLPVFYKFIVVPEGGEAVINYREGKSYQVDLITESGAEYIIPVQPPIRKTPDPDEVRKFHFNEKTYATDSFFPEEFVIAGDEIRARGMRIIPVTIFPVKYNPVSSKIEVYPDIEVDIRIKNADMAKTHQKLSRYSSSLSEVYRASSIGSGLIRWGTKSTGFDSEAILIISNSTFYSTMQDFVEWKEKKGYRVTHVNQSDISSGTTTTGIKNYIQNAYDNWDKPPTFIILVGDSNTIPTFTGEGSDSAADVYYTYLDGSDYFPDAGISRISVRTTTQLNTYLNKLLYYEQYGNSNVSWMNDAALISGEDSGYYTVGEGTFNWVIGTYLDNYDWDYQKLYRHTYDAT